MTASGRSRPRRSLTADLLARGWQRNDEPAEWVGECLHTQGCSRPGRWSHLNVQGYYCAQHAHGAWK